MESERMNTFKWNSDVLVSVEALGMESPSCQNCSLPSWLGSGTIRCHLCARHHSRWEIEVIDGGLCSARTSGHEPGC